ncbi:zinc finger protein 831 [Ranitomeya variabilis]|uniref:zinc finger protein 831 n=1 Tax=Ranitomeya variabilis TaxID=490064 RepID=UPI004056CA5D
MEASNVSILSANLTWPSCTSNDLPHIDNHPSSTGKEKKSPQAVVLNGISLPVVQIAKQEGQQTPIQLASGGTSFAIENANLSVIFTPQPQTILQKTSPQTLTLNIVNTLPILSPTSPAGLLGASTGKLRSIGKHICAHCGRDCLKPSVLEKHIRSHTGERPFPCNICGISFKTQSNLYKHRRTQTHVNNAKQSFDSDGSCHEDRLQVQAGHSANLDISCGTRDVGIDKNRFIWNKTLDDVQERDKLLGEKEISLFSPVKTHDKIHEDPDYSSHTNISPGMPNLQRTVLDPKSKASSRNGQLQRQHETCTDKQWDSSPSERKLKKCESTDSGYLSHSDSADLQMFAGSPLHSLSECSMESENMLGIGSGDSEDKTASLHKKNLEERISMLISQNKAVVDNTHLDNVRPRKTALSKQGSIDLPMPYTFKDSFHFDIKSLDTSRKKVSICSDKSTFIPSEKTKPLFFHSVPTQISTTIESMILTRSNSLPFVESGRLKDRLNVHNVKSHGSGKQSLTASYGNLLLSNTATACTVDFSCSHPRGLVRQAAVDEMQIGSGSFSNSTEEIKEKKKVTGDQISSKSKITNKKGGQRKLNMFSHEKWQMYGDETFKKFYQNIKKNEQVKKSKQDTSESKGTFSHEVCLQSTTELGKQSDNLSSIPMVTPQNPNLHFTCTYAMTSGNNGMDIPISIESPNITLDNDMRAQGIQPEPKYQNSLNVSKIDVNGSENFLENFQNPPAGVSDIVITENQQKGPTISSMHNHLECYYNSNSQSHERSPSDRKKLKVAKLKGEILYSVSLDISEDTIGNQDKNVDDIREIEKTTRTLCGDEVGTVLTCHSLSHREDSGQIPAQSKKGNLFIPAPEPSSAPKESLFSPGYLIKFNFTETSVEESILQSRDNDLANVIEGQNSKSLVVPNKICHETLLEKQLKLTQKHDSVIAPFGKINLNEESVPICCSSKISQHIVQNKSLDTQGSWYQKARLADTCPKSQNKFVENRGVKDHLFKQMDLKASMALESSDTKSTNEVNKFSQDPFLRDIVRPGQSCWKSLKTTGFRHRENSLFPTTCTYFPSDIKVTQVTFSTMNTEPSSTWCWLNRCLPLPVEQKEKSYSVYGSLSSGVFKENRSQLHGRNLEKDINHRITIDGQRVMSSLLMSAKPKDCLKEETGNNYHPLVKRSSKKGTAMKSWHVKRSKDGSCGRSHGKISQQRTSGVIVQDKQHRKINCPSTHESGEILLRTTNFQLRDKDGSRTSIHPTSQPGDLSRESEGRATLDSQISEGSTPTRKLELERLINEEDNKSPQSTKEMTQLEPPHSASLLWQKSCSNDLPTEKEALLHHHLSGCPPPKHVRKILHRSKTIGHSIGDEVIGLVSGFTSSDSQPRNSVEGKDGTRRSSLQNINTPDTYMAQNTSSSGSPLGPGSLSLSWKLQSENDGEPSDHQSLKTQKINLEVMRKQTHLEYSDSSSDDEDRLYILE